ncbi:GNAT family N-acetyltransferase [Sporosarcina sp. CAU 1771]
MDSLIIRQATKIDAQAISNVLTRSQWFTYKDLYSKEYIENMIQQYYNIPRIKEEIVSVTNDWHGYFVAEQQGKIVGVIGGGMLNDSTGEVYVFYLKPEIRGQGIGTRLLDFFTKIQKHTYGAKEQWVSVAKGNIYGIPFYEAKGFQFQDETLTYGSTIEENDISLKYKRDI